MDRFGDIIDRLEFNWFQPSGFEPEQRDAIAAALRSVRDEALEEACVVIADEYKRGSTSNILPLVRSLKSAKETK
jgi:hypothetical protein